MRTRSIFGALLAGTALLAAPVRADTLQEALNAAYRNNPTLMAARAQQRATDETVVIEKAQGRPNASANATYSEILNGASQIGPDRILNAGVDLSVPVYSGGSVKNSVRAADRRIRAGRADLRATESAIFARVVAAYMDVLQSEALAALSANLVEVLGVNLQATSDRFEIGSITRTDVAQSRARLALAQGDLQTSQSSLVQAREAYIALVGEAPDNLQQPPPLPGLPASAADAVAIALEENPDLVAARERAEAAGIDIDVAGAGRLPRVSVFAGSTYQNLLGSLRNPVPGGARPDQDALDASVGLSLRMPLYQGGLPAALERSAQARSQAALESVIATERDVIARVRSAWSVWRAALAVIDSSKVAVDAAVLSLEGVRAENSIGNRVVLDVLDSEQELLNTRVRLISAQRNAYVAGFTLLAAMGRAEARDLGFVEEGLLYDPVVNYDRVAGKWWDWERDPDPAAQGTSTAGVPAPDDSYPRRDDLVGPTR